MNCAKHKNENVNRYSGQEPTILLLYKTKTVGSN